LKIRVEIILLQSTCDFIQVRTAIIKRAETCSMQYTTTITVYIYIYIYRERERERATERVKSERERVKNEKELRAG
jgi:hypothetical protein